VTPPAQGVGLGRRPAAGAHLRPARRGQGAGRRQRIGQRARGRPSRPRPLKKSRHRRRTAELANHASDAHSAGRSVVSGLVGSTATPRWTGRAGPRSARHPGEPHTGGDFALSRDSDSVAGSTHKIGELGMCSIGRPMSSNSSSYSSGWRSTEANREGRGPPPPSAAAAPGRPDPSTRPRGIPPRR
jgi:hypothetical protein